MNTFGDVKSKMQRQASLQPLTVLVYSLYANSGARGLPGWLQVGWRDSQPQVQSPVQLSQFPVPNPGTLLSSPLLIKKEKLKKDGFSHLFHTFHSTITKRRLEIAG